MDSVSLNRAIKGPVPHKRAVKDSASCKRAVKDSASRKRAVKALALHKRAGKVSALHQAGRGDAAAAVKAGGGPRHFGGPPAHYRTCGTYPVNDRRIKALYKSTSGVGRRGWCVCGTNRPNDTPSGRGGQDSEPRPLAHLAPTRSTEKQLSSLSFTSHTFACGHSRSKTPCVFSAHHPTAVYSTRSHSIRKAYLNSACYLFRFRPPLSLLTKPASLLLCLLPRGSLYFAGSIDRGNLCQILPRRSTLRAVYTRLGEVNSI